MSRCIGLAGTNWRYEPIVLAATFLERLAGIRPGEPPTGLLINARAVHGFGLRRPVLVVALDGWGRVIDCRLLRPAAVFRSANAAWLLEIPGPASPPPLGDYLRPYRPRAQGPAG